MANERAQEEDPSPSFTKTEVESFPQNVLLVEEGIREQFQKLAISAGPFAIEYGEDIESESDLKALDSAFYSWQQSDRDAYTDQQVMEILGAYLGEKLCSELGMEWVLVTDQFGTDYAVRAVEFEIMAFPFSSAWKRIEDGQHGFLHAIYESVRSRLSESETMRR